MLKFMMMLMLTFSYLSMFLKHPMSLGICLLVQSITVSSTIRFFTTSSWMSLTLFLVMVGGLMIIFIYMTSICSNQIFSPLKMVWSPDVLLIIFLTLAMPLSSNFYCDHIHQMDFFNMEFYKAFLQLNYQSSIFSFIYLFIMLTVMINLMSMNKGPMRKKY